MEAMAAAYARFQKGYAKGGPSAKPVLKAREDIAEIFMTLKLPLGLTMPMPTPCNADNLVRTQGFVYLRFANQSAQLHGVGIGMVWPGGTGVKQRAASM